MRFLSDNTATACTEILEALSSVNHGSVTAYGDDEWTMRLDAVFGEFFGTPVRAFPVPTGTAANALSIATLSPPYGAVFAHDHAHVVSDECGAVEFFSGARVVGISGEHGKLTVDAVKAHLDSRHVSVHTLQPAVLSLTQATEFGTTYRPEEVAALAGLAHRRGLRVHMDGARFANSLLFLDCHPGDVTWRAGVDVLSFGATKNGAVGAEAVVFFDAPSVKDFELRRKRAGHLLSKSRYISAQLLAYIETGVWKRNAARANELAVQIGRAAGARLLFPVEANEVFVSVGDEGKTRLRAAGFHFYDSGAKESGNARLVVSWDQPEASVTAMCSALTSLV